LRDSRITPIYEGTTAIQANDLIGRKTARDGGKGLGELMADMKKVLEELNAADDVNLKAVATRMAPAIAAAEAANEWLLGQNDPSQPSATSVEFLMMHGRLAGGWMMARAGLAAVAEKKNPDADVAYMDAKTLLARYYAERMMPLVESGKTIIIEGADSTIGLDIAQL